MILKSDQILDEQVTVGDHYRLTYRARFPFFKDTQADLLINRLKENEPRIGNVMGVIKDDLIIVEFDVVKNPFPLVAILTTISIVAGGLFLTLSLERVEKISTSPLGAAFVAIVVGLLASAFIKQRGLLK